MTVPLSWAEIVAAYRAATPLGSLPEDQFIVPPAVAEQARDMFGDERVIVSEYLPPNTAYVYRPPGWLR